MEHVISMEDFHSRKDERKEAGESSRDNDQPVKVAGDTHKLTITILERGSKEEKFKKLKKAETKVRLGATPKIREVVLLLRSNKNLQKYCEPRVISFGPIHHGKPAYRLTEEFKLMLADKFIGESGKSDVKLYDMIEKNIKELREYYDEEVTEKYSDEDLAWMLFVDGCATLQFIYSTFNEKIKDFKIKNVQVAFVKQDLFLLENQLPYRILHHLIQSSDKSENLMNSVEWFINTQSMTREKPREPPNKKPAHLLDLLRNSLIGCTPISPEFGFSYKEWHSFRNVQQLKAAGIHLKSSKESNLESIAFIENWKFYGGDLCLPPINVDDSTRPKLFNLIAYEMSPDFENDYVVTTYISFLHLLIHDAKDVMHLRQAGILRNFLGSDEKVVQVFNEIGTDLVPNREIYGYVGLKLQQYYLKKKVMIWISETLYTRLNNPLSFPVLAFIGAVLALTFSLVQVIYAILSYEYQRRH